jgi:hypothetical protein
MTVSRPTTDAYDVYLANLHLPTDVLAEYTSFIAGDELEAYLCDVEKRGLDEYEPPPRPLAPPVAQPEIVDAKALIDKAIAMVGFEEAERLFRARKVKKKRGRPDYEKIDIGLIWLAGMLQEEWRERLGSSPRGKRLPTRHALATKIVDLFWDDHELAMHSRVRKSLGLSTCLKAFGTDKRTVVKRLLGRCAGLWDAALHPVEEFLDELKRNGPEELYVSHLQMYEARKEERAKGRVGLFEAVHRQRPDLRLLPGKSFR